MEDLLEIKRQLQGGGFITDTNIEDTFFVPEDMSEEQKMIAEMVESFVKGEVWPVSERIENLEEGLAASLMEKMGELGLLGSHMPESYGGMDLDFNTNSIIGEILGKSGSFSVSYNAHTGIGMLPILYFGTDEQKEKYLPNLISGVWKACYCLTEPSSGSDALAARTKAVLSEDGKNYILNGQKMWISNAGFADIFTVFAKIDGDHFTGFILEKGMKGLTLGAEEKKLGIKGSSTRQVFLENVAVPVENVLGEIGKGHLIAFNVLNTGRFKLGASCLGGAKEVISTSINYANERQQFKAPISSFGAIQEKIADQLIEAYVTESAIYRCSSAINDLIIDNKEKGLNYADAKLQAAEELALECSIIKIKASESLDFIVDEAVQIHGGMGYSEEGTVARAYRDSRINRIFEGTNEINKLVIISTLFKKAMKGELDIATPAISVQSELMNGSLSVISDKGRLNGAFNAVLGFKKALHVILGSVGQMAMSGTINLKEEQELLAAMADIVTEVYVTESTLLRAEKVIKNDPGKADVLNAIIDVYFYEASSLIIKRASDAIGIFADESMAMMLVKSVRKLARYKLINIRNLKRMIAEPAIEANEYKV